MVRIINGEIVKDNDPRLKSVPRQGDPVQSSASRPRFADLRSTAAAQAEASRSSHRDGAPATQPPVGGSSSTPRPLPDNSGNPLEQVAHHLGISDKFITIPSIPSLGITETKLGKMFLFICAF